MLRQVSLKYERPCVERPCVERPCVERPCVERPCVERTCVERTCVERLPWQYGAMGESGKEKKEGGGRWGRRERYELRPE